MRRLVPVLAVLGLALTGCGGSDSAGPLEGPLAYMPADSPFVVAIDTDLDGDQYGALDRIIGKFPGGDQIKQRLRQQIEASEGNLSFEELRALMGNPFVVGTDPQSFLSDAGEGDFVAAIQVADRDKLDEVVDRTGSESKGEVAGATLYEDGGDVYAVEGDILVVAGGEEQLRAALERADGEQHVTEDEFAAGLGDLPEDALVRGFFDVGALLESSPDGVAARKIKWIAALTTLGFTIGAEDDGVELGFNLKSDGEDLSERDLPFAVGDDSPAAVREDGRITVALRDPSRMVRFFEQAFQVLEPGQFSDYSTGKLALEKQLGVSVDRDVIDQLSKDLSVTVGLDGSFDARAEVKDPQGLAGTVDKIADALPQLGGPGTRVTRSGDLYLAESPGGDSFAFGMKGDVFLAGSDAARARAAGAGSAEQVPGAKGSLVVTADAEALALEVLERLGPRFGVGGALFGGLFARPLGDLNGWVSTSPDGMRGSFKLGVD